MFYHCSLGSVGSENNPMPTAGKDGNPSSLRVALKSVNGYKKLNPDVIAPLSKQRPFKPLTSLLIHVNPRCSQPLEILRSLTDNVLRGSWDHILNGLAASPAALLMSGVITDREGGLMPYSEVNRVLSRTN